MTFWTHTDHSRSAGRHSTSLCEGFREWVSFQFFLDRGKHFVMCQLMLETNSVLAINIFQECWVQSKAVMNQEVLFFYNLGLNFILRL